MVDITIFELNLDGSEFTANTPWDGSDGESRSLETDEDDGGGLPLGTVAAAGVVGVVLLVVLTVVAKKVRGGEDTDLDAIEDDLA